MDYEDDWYDDNPCPCDSCSESEHCDGWDAIGCGLYNDWAGIEDYDPWDV